MSSAKVKRHFNGSYTSGTITAGPWGVAIVRKYNGYNAGGVAMVNIPGATASDFELFLMDDEEIVYE
jgi:hypothetical protein